MYIWLHNTINRKRNLKKIRDAHRASRVEIYGKDEEGRSYLWSEQRNSVEFILLFCETLEPMSRGYDRAIDFEKLQQTVNLFQSE